MPSWHRTSHVGIESIVGADGDEVRALAEAARQKLRTAGNPTAAELTALRDDTMAQRPALRVLPTGVERPTNTSRLLLEWESFVALVAQVAPSVGRIDRARKPVGTGFVVRPNLVATNRHVAVRLVVGRQVAPDATIRFGDLVDGAADAVRIVAVAGVHPTADVAVLGLARAAPRPPLVLSAKRPSLERPVATIGYPFPDRERNPLFVDDLFPPPLGVQRAAPGDIEGVVGGSIWHDCSTLGGNSGSPVVARDTGEVVGVHFDGSFLVTNKAVPATELAAFLNEIDAVL